MANRRETSMPETLSTSKRGLRLVVSDTSPLNYLIRLGCIDILRELHGTVHVPHAVLAELSHPGAPSEVTAWVADPPSWIEFVAAGELDRTLPAHLGPGEREAISLAEVLADTLLLVDDQQARSAATDRNVETTGTLALVRLASMRGRLDFRQAILQLAEWGFRISPRLQSEILARYERESQEKPL